MKPILAIALAGLLAFSGAAAASDFAARVEANALLDEMGLRAQYEQLVKAALDNQLRLRPELTPYRAVLSNYLNKYMSYDALKPDLVAIYENNFSAAELHDLRVFYDSPTGKKMLRMSGDIARQSAEISQKRMAEHKDELAQMIKDEDARVQRAKDSIVVPESH